MAPVDVRNMSRKADGWLACDACGGKINPNPQNHGDTHRCGPMDWAAHQGRILYLILKTLKGE